MQTIKRAWKRWIAFAHVLGRFQTRVFLTIVYVLFVVPIGLVYRVVGDPLRIKRPPASFHSSALYQDNSVEAARRQF